MVKSSKAKTEQDNNNRNTLQEVKVSVTFEQRDYMPSWFSVIVLLIHDHFTLLYLFISS